MSDTRKSKLLADWIVFGTAVTALVFTALPAAHARADISEEACANPAKALCRDYVKNERTLARKREEILKRLSLSSESEDPPYSNAYYAALEREAFAEIGSDRSAFKQRFEIVRALLIGAVAKHTEIDSALKAKIFLKILTVQFTRRSEAHPRPGQDPCAPDSGLNDNAWAKGDLVAFCPGLLLHSLTHPGIAPLDLVMAHELAHHIDPKALGEDAPVYAPYLSCWGNTLGVNLENNRNEVIADFWSAEVLSALYRTSDPRSLLDALAANLAPFCSGKYDDRESGSPNWLDVHLPTAARVSQAWFYHPELRRQLGCNPFTESFPGCGFSGISPALPESSHY